VINDYTPGTEEVSAVWREWSNYGGLTDRPYDMHKREYLVEEFDRWLEAVRAEAKAEALLEAVIEMERLEEVGRTPRNLTSEEDARLYWELRELGASKWLRARAERLAKE